MLDQVSSVLLQLAATGLGLVATAQLVLRQALNTAQLSTHTDPALISISRDLAGRIVKPQTIYAASSCCFTGKKALKSSVFQL